MFFSRLPLALILLLVGCQTSAPPRAMERLALLPFANLTGDRSLDWLSRGAQVVLNRQLATSRSVSVAPYGDVGGAVLGRATRLLHGVIERRGSGYRVEAFIEDSTTHRQVGDRIELKMPAEQVLGGLDRLAHLLAADAAPLPVTQPTALAAFVEAQSLPQLEAKKAALTHAAQLDPQFALPVMALAELGIGTGHPEDAKAALEAALVRQLDAIERQQVALLAANLNANLANPDRTAQVQALQKLAEAGPSQPGLQLFAASSLERLRQAAPAVTALERGVRVDPENAELWNRLGYARAYLGRLPAARQALETYQRLEPKEPNPFDSLGEVHYLGGEFKAAAEYFQTGFARGPQFNGGRALLKSAYARLLDGQFEPAEQAFAAYVKAAGASPLTEVARAQWLQSSGQSPAALKVLDEAARQATGPLAALFQTHRCGLLLPNDRAAAEAAAKAAMMAGASAPAALCFFLSQPTATPAEWSLRVERAFPGLPAAAFRRQALAYALFFDGRYDDAFPLLEALFLQSDLAADSEVRVFLAECQWRTGRWASARETLARWPLPAPDSLFAGRTITAYLVAILKTGEHFDDNAVAIRWAPIARKLIPAPK